MIVLPILLGLIAFITSLCALIHFELNRNSKSILIFILKHRKYVYLLWEKWHFPHCYFLAAEFPHNWNIKKKKIISGKIFIKKILIPEFSRDLKKFYRWIKFRVIIKHLPIYCKGDSFGKKKHVNTRFCQYIERLNMDIDDFETILEDYK